MARLLAQYQAGQAATESLQQSLNALLNTQASDLGDVLALQDPSRNVGQSALSNLSGLLQGTTLDGQGNVMEISPEERQALSQRLFTESPGYQFQVEQGIQASQRRASARGDLLGGRQLKELQRLGQGYASQEYGNFLNRLGGLADRGQVATQSQVGTSQGFLPQKYDTLASLGNVNAQGASLDVGATALNTRSNQAAENEAFRTELQRRSRSWNY